MDWTDVGVCSAALLSLGAASISSFHDDSDHAMMCAALYPLARDDVLREHPWNCAIRRVILAPMAEPPAFQWDYQFALPDDLLRTLSVGLPHALDAYEIEGGRLLADVGLVQLRYVASVDAPVWDAKLKALMVQRMVSDLAYGVTKSTSKAQAERQIYELQLRKAKAIDGQENPPEELEAESTLLSARFGRA